MWGPGGVWPGGVACGGGGGAVQRGTPPLGPSAAVPQPPSLYLFLGSHGAGAPQHDSRSLEPPPPEMRGGRGGGIGPARGGGTYGLLGH